MIVEHIGIAIKDSKKAIEKYKKLFPNLKIKTEISENKDMKISLLKFENIKIELLEPIKEETIIQKFINKHGEGIHHIAFRVSNIKKMMEDLKYEEVRLIYNDPKLGSNNNLINFLHPKDFNGVLIELCQKQPSSC